MKYGLNIKPEGGLDLVSLGALIHRLDPGIIPFRKATDCHIHVSGGEFNVVANLADCFRLKTGIATAMVDYPIGELIAERVRATGVKPFYRHFRHNGVTTTLREVQSTNRHSWSAVAWIDGEKYQAPTAELDVMDRVGGGDGFAAGFIYGLLSGEEPQEAVNLGWGVTVPPAVVRHPRNPDHHFALRCDSWVAFTVTGCHWYRHRFAEHISNSPVFISSRLIAGFELAASGQNAPWFDALHGGRSPPAAATAQRAPVAIQTMSDSQG